MKYAVVYSSRTGNTKLLAETVRDVLSARPSGECIYFGEPSEAGRKADRIYAGFWTDKGNADEAALEFLKTLEQKEIFLFGTAGFGADPSYFDRILDRVKGDIPASCRVTAAYMCQGKMPGSVRRRYELMHEENPSDERAVRFLENFDQASTHPDEADLERLAAILQALL